MLATSVTLEVTKSNDAFPQRTSAAETRSRSDLESLQFLSSLKHPSFHGFQSFCGLPGVVCSTTSQSLLRTHCLHVWDLLLLSNGREPCLNVSNFRKSRTTTCIALILLVLTTRGATDNNMRSALRWTPVAMVRNSQHLPQAHFQAWPGTIL